ncbi:Stonustoxin subunit beta [Labeo rohita]|uniref:Stonustoxin subunit beta n=1 Tax=Labeo rohita TaxID=84645 RepID=A0ABQ8LKA1_LABRO|nr:Stonustoxin subunit beta [Labeo rohita]
MATLKYQFGRDRLIYNDRSEDPSLEEAVNDFCYLTLDPNTAHNNLKLLESNRKLTCSGTMSYPDHPERFDGLPQVLRKERLSGHCYWEAEWSGLGDMVVSYEAFGRKGKGPETKFG